MGAQLRVYKQKINSAKTTQKITRAMELIAASRIAKARQRAQNARPYSEAITKAVSSVAALSSDSSVAVLEQRPTIRRSAVVVFSSDRGFAGAYSANVHKRADQLANLLHEQGKEVDYYLYGRKVVGYFQFRDRAYTKAWTGMTDAPDSTTAHEISDTVVESYLKGSDEGGVDEIYLVFTRFVSAVVQIPEVVRLLPLEVVDEAPSGEQSAAPLYEYEPDPRTVLDALLPRYIGSVVYHAMLEAAAAKHAATQTAMHAATENANKLVKSYTLRMNTVRQAEVTQQISEIVGGADALTKQKK